MDVAWSSDGNSLAAIGYDGNIYVWDVQDWDKPPRSWNGHTSGTHIAWTPDNQKLATTGWDKTTRLWEAKTGNKIPLELSGDTLESIDWSIDGCQLVATAEGKTLIWKLPCS
jgi:WD40 repeat protein